MTLLAPAAPDIDALYRQYDAPLQRYALRLTHDPDVAADKVQDTWVSAHQSLGARLVQYPDLRIDRWLYQVLKHKVIDHRRLFSTRFERDELPEGLEALFVDGNDPARLQMAADVTGHRRAMAAILLEGTPKRYRQWLWLKEYAGFSHASLGWWFGTTPMASKAMTQRARAAYDAVVRNEVRAQRYGTGIVFRVREKVVKRSPDECWGWNGSATRRREGMRGNEPRISVGNGTAAARMSVNARRVIYLLDRGPLPLTTAVSDTCGNGGCTNGRHLVAVHRIRAAGGGGRYAPVTPAPTWDGMASLRIPLPAELRARHAALGLPQSAVASEAGLAPSAISEVLSGKRSRALLLYVKVGDALERLERRRGR